MTATQDRPVLPPTTAPSPRTDRVLLCCAAGGLAATVAGAVLLGDPLGGAADAAAAAAALDDGGGRLRAAVLVVAAGVLLLTRVVAAVADTALPRPSRALVVPLGVAHLLLTALGLAALGGAAAVGADVLGDGVSPAAAEAALVVLNTTSPVGALVGVAFFASVAAVRAGWMRGTALVMAVGLATPVTGWAFAYLVPLWLAAAAVPLARRSAG